ncbi:MAG: hypothetical protein EOO13_03290 [Chitinophagaceae bacterium]|nr:MAG: hypothetical protein EOO13_03290 [Chitinophagaceae bacterium]
MKTLLAIFLLSLAQLKSNSIISPGLTAVYEHKQQLVKLKWQHNDKQVSRYILQRSADNNRWTDLYEARLDQPAYYKFISYYDNQVQSGRNYYRLKAILSSGSQELTASIMVIIGKPGNSWLMYPVPVKDVLNLQYNGNALITGVVGVVIQRMNGQMYQQLRYASSTRLIQIPVGNLGSGTYDIRISVNNKVVWNQRFIK